MERNFMELLKARWGEGKSACVGLDSDLAKIPETVKNDSINLTLESFNHAIVSATCDLVCAYKPNIAFYEAWGEEGISVLKTTVVFIKNVAPEVPIIGDMKRGDIGNTNLGYIKEAFEYFGFDAITVPPYMGKESLQPFLDMKDKGIIVLCRTSNPGAGEFQGLYTLPFDPGAKPDGVTDEEWLEKLREESAILYQRVARNVVTNWNQNGNCGLVVGATAPEELEKVRHIVGDDMPLLIPGIGAQGGETEATVKAGKNSKGQGMIINSSRGIIFASKEKDFAEVARKETVKLQEMINQYL